VLPGSHTKFISLDQDERIAACATTLAGELLQSITQNTILAQSLDRKFATEIKAPMVLAGAALAQKSGIGRACFSIRILDQFQLGDVDDRANFLLGAILSSDLQALKHSSAIHMHPDTPIVIAGKGVVKQALALLIEQDPYFCGKLTLADDAQHARLAGQGAIRVALARGLCVEL
jgi:2-dehydro-3-deoxygalactonokinase